MTFGNVSMCGTDNGNGTPCSAEQWYDNSPQHRITRCDDFQSAEIDVVHQHVCGGGCSCFNLDCLAGVRYFHFGDKLCFQAQREHDGSAYEDTWISLDDKVTNDLLGFQLGCCGIPFRALLEGVRRARIALCDDMIGLNYNLYAVGANGACYQGSSNTYASPNYPIHSTSSGFSLLTHSTWAWIGRLHSTSERRSATAWWALRAWPCPTTRSPAWPTTPATSP